MKMIKEKTPAQLQYVNIIRNRLTGTDRELLLAGEPMLAMKLEKLIGELDMIVKANG